MNETEHGEAHACEPEHIFRVERHDEDPMYIAADNMAVGQTGIVQFFIRGEFQPVALFFPSPCLMVVRVDTLITKEAMPK